MIDNDLYLLEFNENPSKLSFTKEITSTGSVHDSQVVQDITEELEGLFVADAGYILKDEIFQSLLKNTVIFLQQQEKI